MHVVLQVVPLAQSRVPPQLSVNGAEHVPLPSQVRCAVCVLGIVVSGLSAQDSAAQTVYFAQLPLALQLPLVPQDAAS